MDLMKLLRLNVGQFLEKTINEVKLNFASVINMDRRGAEPSFDFEPWTSF